MKSFEELKGETLTSVDVQGDEQITFTLLTGEKYMLFHRQDCCESVTISDICGDIDDLIGSPLILAEESTNERDPPPSGWGYSFTWTFYRLATAKGHVDIRWLGESNGYYSESVDFEAIGG